MTNYWIKLYHEILDDPKMATLPDRLWRRVIELFLMAGRTNKDGWIPDTRQIAWIMRMPTDELELDLQQIASTGIIERVIDGWIVCKFAQRQAPSPARERKRQQRERERKNQYYLAPLVTENVTNQSRNVTQITDNITYTESEFNSKNPEIFKIWKTACNLIVEGMPKANRPHLHETILVEYDNDNHIFTANVKDDHERDWLNSRVLKSLETQLTGIINQQTRVLFKVKG